MSLKAKNSVAFYNHLIKTLPHTHTKMLRKCKDSINLCKNSNLIDLYICNWSNPVDAKWKHRE